MFISTHFPSPLLPSATSFSDHTTSSSPGTTAALDEFDSVLRRAFGGTGEGSTADLINAITEYVTIATIFIGIWMVFLAFKFVLGIGLLGVARRRYKGMKERERGNYTVPGGGSGGVAEVTEENKKWIHAALPGEKDGKEGGSTGGKKVTPLGEVERFDMVAKRIW